MQQMEKNVAVWSFSCQNVTVTVVTGFSLHNRVLGEEQSSVREEFGDSHSLSEIREEQKQWKMEKKKLILKMGCVQIQCCLPKERGSDTWRDRVWPHTATVWQDGLRSGKLCSKWLCFQVSEPWGIWPRRCSWKQELQKEAKIRKSWNKSWAPCVRAHKNALTVEPLFLLALDFSRGPVPNDNFLLESCWESWWKWVAKEGDCILPHFFRDQLYLVCFTSRVMSALYHVSQPQGSPLPSAPLWC